MKKDIDKDDILKIMKRQMIAFLMLLIVVAGGFIYMSNQILKLEDKVRTMGHELDYIKCRIEKIRKK